MDILDGDVFQKSATSGIMDDLYFTEDFILFNFKILFWKISFFKFIKYSYLIQKLEIRFVFTFVGKMSTDEKLKNLFLILFRFILNE